MSLDFLKSCDFELALKVMDKFVEKVFIVSDKYQKKILVEKSKDIKNYLNCCLNRMKMIFKIRVIPKSMYQMKFG